MLERLSTRLMPLLLFVVLMTAGAGASFAQTCGTTTWNLTAGQTIDVGSVTVSNDAENLYVTYKLDYPGAYFGTLHLWAGNDIATCRRTPKERLSQANSRSSTRRRTTPRPNIPSPSPSRIFSYKTSPKCAA
jgi:hypothetical protein